jgi:Fuc2NAc and GlcNAc transferase
MSELNLLVLTVGALALSWWLTGRFRNYALRRDLVDVPNARSSHIQATPRGGGVGFVVASLVAFVTLGFMGRGSWPLVVGLTGAGLLVAVIGLVDDFRSVPARYRLLAHFSAAAWFLAWLRQADLAAVVLPIFLPGWLVAVLAAVFVVWLVNLTNFMDGIDGIAGSEGVTVLLSAAGLQWSCNTGYALPLVAGATILAFLLWNWPPAKIFMGDVGSGYLGLLFGTLALLAGIVTPSLFWAWLILLGCFVVDTTLTLARRVMRGEKFYQAHRSHAYQYAARRAGSHRPVTLAVIAINVGWLLPIAWLTTRGVLPAAWAIVVAYAPICVLAVIFRAGEAASVSAAGK